MSTEHPTRTVDVAIVGAGSGGLSAWSEVKKQTQNVVVINDGPHGTTCARVGCMPSKVLIQIAEDFHRRDALALEGIEGGHTLSIDTERSMRFVRALRDRFVRGVLTGTIESIGDRNITGRAVFEDAHTLRVGDELIRAERIILATGSRPIVPDAWRNFGDAVLTSDTVFEQVDLPRRIAVAGSGIIGLELGQALSRIGIQVTVIGRSGRVGGLTDPEINTYAVAALGADVPLAFAKDLQVTQQADGSLRVCDGNEEIMVADAILSALGRTPNVDAIGLEKLGVELDANGIPPFDPKTMQIGDLPIFIAGDVTNELPLLHEASDEGRIAGYNATHEPIRAFQRRTPLKVTFSDPNIATVGFTHRELSGTDYAVGQVTFEGQGRSIVMSRESGLLNVYGRSSDGRLLGAELIAPRGEHLAHLLSWVIQQNCTVFDALRLPFYHPVVEEGLRTALRDLAEKIQPEGRPMEIAFRDE